MQEDIKLTEILRKISSIRENMTNEQKIKFALLCSLEETKRLILTLSKNNY